MQSCQSISKQNLLHPKARLEKVKKALICRETMKTGLVDQVWLEKEIQHPL